ncbi:unnamed protein product [Blepharisma stoltei]|uniref:Uncharacterized protein n=1 Tax=Blepharisma stoltei TaxID=1481888 RepID=A0AAU9IZ13_9CILI|nr:unnamed protein product [Blepharisma stoltei]
MGNELGCECLVKDKPDFQYKNHTNSHIIIDGPVKIVDDSRLFEEAHTLIELKTKMKHYVPYEIKCVKDKTIDIFHSFVRVIGMKQTKDDIIAIVVEIIFSSLGNFLICISDYDESIRDYKLGGVLELSYVFPQNTVFQRNFKDFFEWLDAYKSRQIQIDFDETFNMGKIVYGIFKSMGNREGNDEF